MTTMTCLHCGAETSNGLALCERCQIAGAVIFEFLPVYFRNLARWRPGRAGGRPVPGSRQPTTLGMGSAGDYVSNVLDESGSAISTWARMLHDDRDIELPAQDEEAATVAALCRLFAENLTSIATLEWCGQFLDDMADHEQKLRRLTERVAPGWYAGECERCGVETHVIPGLTWVTCGGCGVTTYARDHLPAIIYEARGWVARPMRLAEAVVALIDGELSVPRLHKRISKWGERTDGRCITAIRKRDKDGDEVGPKCYRLGEVLDLLTAEGATRLNDTAPIATRAS